MLRQALACCAVGIELVCCVDASTEKREKKCYLYWRLFSFKINSQHKLCALTSTAHHLFFFFSFSRTVFLYPKIRFHLGIYYIHIPSEHLGSPVKVVPNTKEFGDLYNLHTQLGEGIKGKRAVLRCL